ncbi:chaperone NapD [Nitratireductor sp. ZSWI3]|uniref:chaperone NapD n=1 Tax=Nitratireductor sp. ZSWI3 TaxID=2966359 RepID=UPI00215030B9|nr:chaperone NapD [Nitratireductor sp. ZSWI3]MCR4264740.1 chaperone NapD [Nitratireductor sp. ZSWI3]
MPERSFLHVSSAVVCVRPERAQAVIAAISAMQATEVHAHDAARIVVVMEGRSTGELGDRLASIALTPGVIAANMVFEHVEELEETPS